MDETWGTGPKFCAEEDENSVGHYGLILGPKMAHFCPKTAFLAYFGINEGISIFFNIQNG